MNHTMSLALVAGGVILLLISALTHFAVHAQILPHFSLIMGVIALAVVALGGFGMVSGVKNS